MHYKNFIASAIDELPSAYVDKFAMLIFDKLKEEVLARPELSANERAWFER